MSNLNFDFSENDFRPLAARMRPTNLEQYYGPVSYTHLVGRMELINHNIQSLCQNVSAVVLKENGQIIREYYSLP